MKIKDKPAYPVKWDDGSASPGMTLFESFVKAAMHGYIIAGKMGMGDIAEAAIIQSKAQIEALEKHYEAEKEKKA